MIFWGSIVIILIISFLLSLRSLFSELQKPKELQKIKKSLAREKILYKKD